MVSIPVIVDTAQNSGGENHLAKSGNADILWIKKVLDNWNYVCLNELNIEVNTLPWIIFYDSSSAWHLNADENMLPSFEKTPDSVVFAGISYQLIRIAHTESIWVPDREPIPLASSLVTTIPYAENKISGPVFDVLNDGGVLVIDELDASLHPLLTLAVTRLFNSADFNQKNA
ncbi:hypothetical protein [Flavitalea sp.]|nr:hypothetical protein [Flavitalea sp.]